MDVFDSSDPHAGVMRMRTGSCGGRNTVSQSASTLKELLYISPSHKLMISSLCACVACSHPGQVFFITLEEEVEEEVEEEEE